MSAITLDRTPDWRQIAAIAHGAELRLTPRTLDRLAHSRAIVDAIIARGIRAYGVNTGVGALSDTPVSLDQQRALSRNLIMSHSVGVGDLLPETETRAILAAAITNFAHGYSGIRPRTVEALVSLLNAGLIPEVPARGSVGYLSHMAHAAQVLIGEGFVRRKGTRIAARDALAEIGLLPLVLEAKEGLSLINGTPCATGMAAVALDRCERLLDWADATGAMSFENLHGQIEAFADQPMALRKSEGLQTVAARLRALLSGSGILAAHAGARTQDPLSLRSIPHVHGAARDMFAVVADAVNRELASVTDNPLVMGTPEAPQVHSQAHAVGAALSLALDAMGIAIAEVAAMAERRLDRLVNPLVSRLPAFLAHDSGAASGFMIAQYTAVSLVSENRRHAMPAGLDGGTTSALQEDFLTHATPAALKLLAIIANTETILGIELLANGQAYDMQPNGQAGGSSHGPSNGLARAAGTNRLYRHLRATVPAYCDDRPLAELIHHAAELIRHQAP